jgi:NAD(P)H-flavin reductase/hemoglobin-like flavoprotein
MTTRELLVADLPTLQKDSSRTSRLAEIVRRSWAALEPRTEDLSRHFYATLFARAPETRDLFPVNMDIQRSRLLRAIVHVVQVVDETEQLAPFLAQLGRDHRKFGVIAEHYDAVANALVSAIATFAGDAWSAEVEEAWTEMYGLVGDAMRTAAAAERGPAFWIGRVVDHRRIGWDLAIITLQTSEPVPYRAGQYLSVETPQRPRLWRYLSPANAPSPDNVMEFHVRAVPGGWVSRAMVAHTRVGDTWRLGPPMGRLHLQPSGERGVLMVAGGTGSAPMKALLEDLRARPAPPRTQVFVGGRTWEDLYDLPALRRLTFDSPWLDVAAVVEDDTGPLDAERGTLADAVTRYGAWTDHDVLICGSPIMIRATVSRMLVAGTPLDRIGYDPFTMD